MQLSFKVGAIALLASRVVADPAAQPAVTARAMLPRQDSNPALVGYISTSGATSLSNLQTCDFPATLSVSDSYAQCCAPNQPCPFWTACSNGNLIGASATQFCDTGACNTGVIVASEGAPQGGDAATSYVACWATELVGTEAFGLIRDGGDNVAVPTPTGAVSSGVPASSGAGQTPGRTSAGSSRATGGAAATSTSQGAAAEQTARVVFGGVAGLMALAAAAL